MEKYGFVYIWFDVFRKMYYIGSHWGTIEDGYVCSSNRMRDAYRRRPNNFKRKILEKVEKRKMLLETEQKWLSLAEKTPNRYYNLSFVTKNPWWNNEQSKLTVGQKISKSQKSNPNFGSWSKGKKLSEETKQKISRSTSKAMVEHYKNNPRTEETRKKISENSKKLQAEGKIGMHGKKHSSETIQKMKVNNAMNNPKHIAKVKASKQGIRWLTNGVERKMSIPGSDKYNDLITLGFKVP
jgi:superfamily II DNA helicase RecQ